MRTMMRAIEWAALIWFSLWLLIPITLLGSWIADQLDRYTGRRTA